MGYDEMLLADYQADVDRAEADEWRQEEIAAEWRKDFKDAAATCDVEAETGFKALPKLIDIYDEAVTQTDQTIHREAFRALLLLARKGQIEAVEWMQRFEDKYMEFREA